MLAQEFVLSEFNGTGFDYTFSGFEQTTGPDSVRLNDPNDGWGGAGIGVGSLDLSSYADGRLVVDLIANPGNQAGRFDIELVDLSGPGGTERSGKWTFNLSELSPGQPTRLVSSTVVSSPTSGIGDFSSFDLSQVQTWQVLGDFGSSSPIDLSFDRIAIATDAPAYPGAEADAPWRTQAATRIDAHRKADLRVEVVDASGAPVPNAAVGVAMQRHEFGFGSAVQAYRLRDSSPQHDEYKARVADLFNAATLENNLKWQPWEGEWGGNFTQSGALSALDWLNGQGIDARGHVLIWPGSENLPADIQQMLSDNTLTPAEQQQVKSRIAGHIADIAGATQGKLAAWDVINETRTNNDLMRELPEQDAAMVEWLQRAQSADPNATRYINDFGILNSWGAGANRDQYFNTIQYLVNQGAPLDGIGFQGHFSDDDLTGPEELWSVIDRFAALGLDMQITEFDLTTDDESLQAAYTRDFMTAMFAHEAIDDFLLWGFWEDAHWRPSAALYRSDWSIKPNGQAYNDLVFGEWWTDESGQADGEGALDLRGFKGEYQIAVSFAGQSAEVAATLGDGGQTVVVTLPMLLGDYSGDGVVDVADYTVWRDALGSTSDLAADGNGNGVIDLADYEVWRRQFGASAPTALAVPEPGATVIALGVALTHLLLHRSAR